LTDWDGGKVDFLGREIPSSPRAAIVVVGKKNGHRNAERLFPGRVTDNDQFLGVGVSADQYKMDDSRILYECAQGAVCVDLTRNGP